MSMIWFVVLLLYGAVIGFAEISGLAWWMLLPFYFQDAYNHRHKKQAATVAAGVAK